MSLVTAKHPKICFVLPRILAGESGVLVGGCIANCTTLALELKRRGVQIDLLTTLSKESAKRVKDHPISEVLRPVLGETGRPFLNGIRTIQILRREFKKAMLRENYTLVHGHSGTFPYALVPLVGDARRTLRIHSLYCPLGGRGGIFRSHWEQPVLVRGILNRLDACVAVTQNVYNSLLKIRIASSRIYLLRMSVDTNRFSPSVNRVEVEYYPKDSVGSRFLFVGNASKEKGLEELLVALSLLVKKGLSPFLVVTLENQRHVPHYNHGEQCAKDLVHTLGIDGYVKFYGLVDRLEDLLAQTDAVVVPWNTTRGPSDYPMVALEAMAMGKCVIATPVGGCPELLEDGRAGLLTQGIDSTSIANSMEFLMTDDETRKALGQKAYEISYRFSVERAGEELLSLYDHLITERGGSFHS